MSRNIFRESHVTELENTENFQNNQMGIINQMIYIGYSLVKEGVVAVENSRILQGVSVSFGITT